MCKCTPNIRTPFCGKPGCEWPEVKSGDISPELSGRVDLEEYVGAGAKLKSFEMPAHSGLKKRKGLKLLAVPPEAEAVVNMMSFKGQVLIACTGGIYELIDDELVPLEVDDVQD